MWMLRKELKYNKLLPRVKIQAGAMCNNICNGDYYEGKGLCVCCVGYMKSPVSVDISDPTTYHILV